MRKKVRKIRRSSVNKKQNCIVDKIAIKKISLRITPKTKKELFNISLWINNYSASHRYKQTHIIQGSHHIMLHAAKWLAAICFFIA